MLVGPTMAGKTCCHRVLAKALTELRAAGDPWFDKVGGDITKCEHGCGDRIYMVLPCTMQQHGLALLQTVVT